MGDIGVSISEIVEVRGCGLNDDELLALIIIGCEVLSKAPRGVFSPSQVFVHNEGDLQIEIVTPKDVSEQYVPPEMLVDSDVDAGAVHVFCLGEVIRFAGAETSENADLFSLLNVMTVSHVATRPSIVRLSQMAKNKLKIQNPKALLAEMYVLVMGEEGEDEDFDVSSGEYILEELDENGDLKEIDFSLRKGIGLQNSNSTKTNDNDDEVSTVQSKDIENEWLKSSKYMDPFEEDDSTNLATLSGRDPFNKEFIQTLSGAGTFDGLNLKEEFRSEISEVDETPAEKPKQKHRQVLVDPLKMLVGSSETTLETAENETNQSEKPLWSEAAKRYRPFEYDDEEIVEYKENVEDDDNEAKPIKLNNATLPKVQPVSEDQCFLTDFPISSINKATEPYDKIVEQVEEVEEKPIHTAILPTLPSLSSSPLSITKKELGDNEIALPELHSAMLTDRTNIDKVEQKELIKSNSLELAVPETIKEEEPVKHVDRKIIKKLPSFDVDGTANTTDDKAGSEDVPSSSYRLNS
uniref:KIND domain-containing protein n=1 Tax=Syphacia muris TaxID=451379 RepID=A0A0N5AXK2_9BILA